MGDLAVHDVLSRVGISFTFPRLGWLLTWTSLYIVAIGVVNFAILRRMDKLEWGWITVCITALMFAGGLYSTSSSRRPKDFTLDDVRAYWMDGSSPAAFQQIGIRVSSPERAQFGLSINDDVILAPSDSQAFESPGVDIGTEMTGRPRLEPGWQIELGPPLQMQLGMLRWSFKDLYFEGIRELPGTVHWTSGSRLRNDTGQIFREAIYLDFPKNEELIVHGLAPGKELDLANLTPKEIYGDKKKGTVGRIQLNQMPQQPRKGPLSVEEVPYLGINLGPGRQVFVGLRDVPESNVKLSVAENMRQSISLTIVCLDRP